MSPQQSECGNEHRNSFGANEIVQKSLHALEIQKRDDAVVCFKERETKRTHVMM